MSECYLGVDVGSVSTNVVLVEGDGQIVHRQYLKTAGRPVEVVQGALAALQPEMGGRAVAGVGTTGSGRALAAAMLGADVVKNEITAHAVAAQRHRADVRTVLEIGGQDSKIIFLQDGVVTDFAMNTVCAAGTGSFLDRQAERLDVPIADFGRLALQSDHPVAIAGRCAVFAESDMIHQQQNGHGQPDIIAGLCQALVRNYLNNLAKGRAIAGPVVFQGGVAANAGMVRAFEQALGCPVEVPPHHDVMGAWGAALLARRQATRQGVPTAFAGFEGLRRTFRSRTRRCGGCGNDCEVVLFGTDEGVLARWGGRCPRAQTLE